MKTQVNRAYKIRLYPTVIQEQELLRICGASRYVWNHYLAKRVQEYQTSGKSSSIFACSRDLTQLRKATPWLQGLNLGSLNQSLRALDKTYRQFFKTKRGFPNFKAKKNPHQSFIKTGCWKVIANRIVIFKEASVKFRGTLDPIIPKKTLVVMRESTGKWYATAVYKKQVTRPKKRIMPIGIDLGLKHLITTSDGHMYDGVPSLIDRVKILSRRLSRAKQGSQLRLKAKVALSRIHERIANIRKDHTHKVSTDIASKNHAAIVCEDLNVKGMLGNHKLARSIGNANWSELLRQLQYKQEERGGKVLQVDRFFPSSKLCSSCGFLRDSLPLNIREWNCPNCGQKHDRDINAAMNILKEGLRNNPALRTWVRRRANVA